MIEGEREGDRRWGGEEGGEQTMAGRRGGEEGELSKALED